MQFRDGSLDPSEPPAIARECFEYQEEIKVRNTFFFFFTVYFPAEKKNRISPIKV